MEVVDPGKGTPIAEVLGVGETGAMAAVDAAADALPGWRATAAADRGRVLHRLADLMKRDEQSLAAILTLEHGKPVGEAAGEIRYAASFVRWFAEEARRAYGETIPAPSPDRRLVVVRQPVGIAAGITPWNFPSAMITRKLAPALAAGCTFVLKPAEATPLSALALAVLCEEAGVPKGVFNVVVGPNPAAIATPWLGDARVRKLSFTGSTQVGKALYAACAPTVKKVALELGGNAPFIVFDDADIDAAVEGAMVAKFRNGGQSCVAANRILVAKSREAELVEKLAAAVGALRAGYGFDEGVQVGPLINEMARAKISKLVDDARASGAETAVGGSAIEREGTFFAPTLMTGIGASMSISSEEVFGPVATVQTFEDEEEALRLANATRYGLAAYFYARDIGRVWRVAEALDFGMVGVNTGMISAAEAPFGGIKESGLGREGSRHGLDEYSELKYIAMAGLSS